MSSSAMRDVSVRDRHQIDQSWNRRSTLVALAALIISVVSAGASAWQVLLVKEQLTAGDRNRSFQELVQQTGNMCELFFPNRIRSYSYAAQNDGTSIIAVAQEDIDPSIYSEELAEKIASEARKLRLAFTIANIWASSWQNNRFSIAQNIVMETFQYFSSPHLSDMGYREAFAMRYVLASHECTNDRGLTLSAQIAGLVNDEGSWWLQPDNKSTQVVLAPKDILNGLTREQIQALANQQTTTLKTFDSYNQL
jgi:hypothetical protein